MAYTPTTWATGDIVTAEKLNKLEQGVEGAGGSLVATGTYRAATGAVSGADYEMSLNKTYAQIEAAMEAGQSVMISVPESYPAVSYAVAGHYAIVSVECVNDVYYVYGFVGANPTTFESATEDGELVAGFWV